MSNTQPSPFNLNCLNNRVALITGGASGIGLEIAKQLGLHGSKIAIMGRRMEFIEKALAVLKELKIDAIGFTGDVRVEEDTNRVVALTVEHFGKLDTLVNSAAGNFLAAAEHLKPKGFRTVLEIDAIGVFNMSKAAFEQLKASKQGVIINISATLHYGATWYQVIIQLIEINIICKSIQMHSFQIIYLNYKRYQEMKIMIRKYFNL